MSEKRPEDYGAAGNGTTDDTTAVRNAIAGVPDGGTLRLPGLYRITDTITINRGISVRGDGTGSGFRVDLTDNTKTAVVFGDLAAAGNAAAQNQVYRDFGVYGATGTARCKHGVAVYHVHRSRFENVHVRPNSSHQAVVVGGCLLSYFNFICQGNSSAGYPASDLWNGAGIFVVDMNSWPGSGSDMPVNGSIFDCIVEGGGTTGGFYGQTQGYGGSACVITGTYEGLLNTGNSTVAGAGYSIFVDGWNGFAVQDAYTEQTQNGMRVQNSTAFRIEGGIAAPNPAETVSIAGCTEFVVEGLLAGTLKVDNASRHGALRNVTGAIAVDAAYTDVTVENCWNPASTVTGSGTGPYSVQGLFRNGDFSRPADDWAYAANSGGEFYFVGTAPTVAVDAARRFGAASRSVQGSGTSQTLTIHPRVNSIWLTAGNDLLNGQTVTVWVDVKRVSGPGLALSVVNNGTEVTGDSVPSTETGWVRLAATFVVAGEFYIHVKPLTNSAYSYLLGGYGGIPGTSAPAGTEPEYGSFQQGVQVGGRRIQVGSAPPTTGDWITGDVVFNTNPGSNNFVGWTCVTAGRPGTWKTFGAVV